MEDWVVQRRGSSTRANFSGLEKSHGGMISSDNNAYIKKKRSEQLILICVIHIEVKRDQDVELVRQKAGDKCRN